MNEFINIVLYSNLMPFILLLIFFILVLYNPIFNKRQERLFLLITALILGMLIAISMDYLISINVQWKHLWYIRRITTFLNFAISPCLPLLLYKISESNKSPSTWFYIPFISNFILCILSIPFGFIFNITTTNTYDRGDLFLIPFITTLIYILVIILKGNRTKLRGRHFERIFLIGFIIFLLMSLILEVQFYFRFLTWTCAAISIPLYYILLNINYSILDPLTGCFNRSMYNKDIRRIETLGHGIIALLDINNFKHINDTYGHEVGDQYLIKLVTTVGNELPSFAGLYRIGGDEFIIISKKDELEKIRTSLDKARAQLYTENMYFSYGIARYDDSTEMQEFLNMIDKVMYENKGLDKISHPTKI